MSFTLDKLNSVWIINIWVVTPNFWFKVGVNMNRIEIWSNRKMTLLGLKWLGSITRQFTT